MPLITLSPLLLLITDSLAWLLFHLGISFGLRKVSDAFFERHANCFRSFAFEKGGRIWSEVFRIRQWKDKLPDGTVIAKKGFDKSRLAQQQKDYLEKFVIETRRAELTHWLLMVPAPFFFLWNPAWAGWVMIVYALLANCPFIMIQRYNRPRLERVLRKKSALQVKQKATV